jgi:hypothetical protein
MKEKSPQTAVQPENPRDIAALARDRARAELAAARIETTAADLSDKPGVPKVANCGATLRKG